jgi:cyclophilin family peptidyl-prolyl cis-trans isomerase
MRRALAGLALLMTLGLDRLECQPQWSDERVILRTTAGDLTLVFYPSIAPEHVKQILQLVRLGAYDTVEIFRVVPGFLVQVSEVDARRLPVSEAQRSALRNLPLELANLEHRRGMLSMARREDDTMSARTSFSILIADAPHLDGKYTIFGQVEAGYDVLDEIAEVERDENDRPLKRIEILKAEVIPTATALADVYLAGPKPLEEGTAVWAPKGMQRFFLAATSLMLILSFASFALADRVSKRVHSSLSLLVCLVGAFGLFVYFAPSTKFNHLHSIAILLGILALLKLMGMFENPNRGGR